jgi:hypothetical protein
VNHSRYHQLDICSAAELPEKLGIDENDIYVLEGRRFPTSEDALKACPELSITQGAPRFIILEAMVPKLPAAVAKAIEEYRAKLPKLKEKYQTLREMDPETGEENWLQNLQKEIIARTKAGKSKSEKGEEKLKTCDGCKSKINIAHIKSYLCPVCEIFPFMETNTDKKFISNRVQRLHDLWTEIEQGDQTLAIMEAEGKKNAVDFKRAWLVFRDEEVPAPVEQLDLPLDTPDEAGDQPVAAVPAEAEEFAVEAVGD